MYKEYFKVKFMNCLKKTYHDASKYELSIVHITTFLYNPVGREKQNSGVHEGRASYETMVLTLQLLVLRVTKIITMFCLSSQNFCTLFHYSQIVSSQTILQRKHFILIMNQTMAYI